MEDYLDKAYNKFKSADSKYNNDAYNYVKKIVSSTSMVFDSSVSIDTISTAIYETLLYEKYTDYDILKNKCNEKILQYITNKKFNNKFNNKFNEIYDYTRNTTNVKFNQRKQRIRNDGKNPSVYYDSRVEKNKVAFSVAFNIYAKNLDVEELYKSGELNSMIENRINVDIFKKDSISKKANNKALYENRIYHTVDSDTVKKFVIGMLILFGIAGISYKKNDTNSNKNTYVPPKNQYVEQKTPDENDDIIRAIDKDKIDIRIIEKIIANNEKGQTRGDN